MIGLIFKSKNDGDDKVVVYGVLNYVFSKDVLPHSESCKNYAQEHGDNFIVVRCKAIIDGKHRSMSLESFFESYELFTQKFDDTKWIS